MRSGCGRKKVYEEIRTVVDQGNRVVLSFESVTRLTTAFLNAAVGQLYNDFSEEEVRKIMAPPINADAHQLARLKLVVDRAKDYFKNPDQAKQTFADITGLDDEDND